MSVRRPSNPAIVTFSVLALAAAIPALMPRTLTVQSSEAAEDLIVHPGLRSDLRVGAVGPVRDRTEADGEDDAARSVTR